MSIPGPSLIFLTVTRKDDDAAFEYEAACFGVTETFDQLGLVRWCGGRLIVNGVGGKELAPQKRLIVIDVPHEPEMIVRFGDYIVKWDHNEFEKFTPEEFTEEFEVVRRVARRV